VFLSGVLVLTLSTVLVKLIGMLYKIPMLHYLGSEGMGYFNAAYEWYATLCVIATSGLPLASSMFIARARAVGCPEAVRRVERLSLLVFACLGAVGALALWLGAGPLAALIGSPATRYALMATAPTILFSCLSGAYRGYFQGHKNMVPTAVSQVIEALGKLILGLSFSYIAQRRGMDAPRIAAWAMVGLGIGVAVSTLYLMWWRAGYRPSKASVEEQGEASLDVKTITLRRLLSIAIPVTLSSSVVSVTRLFDVALILRRLQHIGYDTAGANELYGCYTTMVIPLFNLVPSLITSVALALVPSLTAAIKTGDVSTQVSTARTAIRLTALLSLPASLAISIYSETILTLLFRGEDASIALAAPMLSILAISIFFSGSITTTNAILQAYGRVKAPICSMLAGSAFKLVVAYVLIGLPTVNIYGAPISTFLCDAMIVGINLFLIARHTDVLGSIKEMLVRPLAISALSVGLPGVAYALLTRAGYPPLPLFLSAVPVTVALYLLLCLGGGLIGEQEMALLPPGLAKRFQYFCKTAPPKTE
jgi:stage V sporulation protein B